MLKTKLALIVISVILAGSLAANAYLYALQQHSSAENKNLEKQIGDLKNELATLSNKTEELQSRKVSLEIKITALEDQITNLKYQSEKAKRENLNIADENAEIQRQIDQIKQRGVPKIITRLGTADVRSTPAGGHPWSGVIRFYVSGEVWNMGTGSARDCRLHITLYQGDKVANDTYVKIGTIEAGTYVEVAVNIYYDGEALTNFLIIPECT